MNIKKLFIATFIFLGISFFVNDSAFAYTFHIAQGNDGRSLSATVNLTKSNYNPGEQVIGTVCLDNNSSSLNNLSLAGGTNGHWQTYLTSANCAPNQNMGNAPSNPGTYAVNYSAGFNRVSAPQAPFYIDIVPNAYYHPQYYDSTYQGAETAICYWRFEIREFVPELITVQYDRIYPGIGPGDRQSMSFPRSSSSTTSYTFSDIVGFYGGNNYQDSSGGYERMQYECNQNVLKQHFANIALFPNTLSNGRPVVLRY